MEQEIFQKEVISSKSEDDMAYYEYDFTMKEIGDFLGVYYSNVSRVVKKHECTKKNEKQKD